MEPEGLIARLLSRVDNGITRIIWNNSAMLEAVCTQQWIVRILSVMRDGANAKVSFKWNHKVSLLAESINLNMRSIIFRLR